MSKDNIPQCGYMIKRRGGAAKNRKIEQCPEKGLHELNGTHYCHRHKKMKTKQIEKVGVIPKPISSTQQSMGPSGIKNKKDISETVDFSSPPESPSARFEDSSSTSSGYPSDDPEEIEAAADESKLLVTEKKFTPKQRLLLKQLDEVPYEDDIVPKGSHPTTTKSKKVKDTKIPPTPNEPTVEIPASDDDSGVEKTKSKFTSKDLFINSCGNVLWLAEQYAAKGQGYDIRGTAYEFMTQEDTIPLLEECYIEMCPDEIDLPSWFKLGYILASVAGRRYMINTGRLPPGPDGKVAMMGNIPLPVGLPDYSPIHAE